MELCGAQPPCKSQTPCSQSSDAFSSSTSAAAAPTALTSMCAALQILHWEDFDIFELASLTHGRALFTVCMCLMEQEQLLVRPLQDADVASDCYCPFPFGYLRNLRLCLWALDTCWWEVLPVGPLLCTPASDLHSCIMPEGREVLLMRLNARTAAAVWLSSRSTVQGKARSGGMQERHSTINCCRAPLPRALLQCAWGQRLRCRSGTVPEQRRNCLFLHATVLPRASVCMCMRDCCSRL